MEHMLSFRYNELPGDLFIGMNVEEPGTILLPFSNRIRLYGGQPNQGWRSHLRTGKTRQEPEQARLR